MDDTISPLMSVWVGNEVLLPIESSLDDQQIISLKFNEKITAQIKIEEKERFHQDDLWNNQGDIDDDHTKQVGGDILNAKKTYLLVKALALADQKDSQEIIGLIANTGLANEDKIAAVRTLYDQYKLNEFTFLCFDSFLLLTNSS